MTILVLEPRPRPGVREIYDFIRQKPNARHSIRDIFLQFAGEANLDVNHPQRANLFRKTQAARRSLAKARPGSRWIVSKGPARLERVWTLEESR